MMRTKKEAALRNEGPGYRVFQVFNYMFMVLLIIVTVLPYMNVMAKAFNDGVDSMRGGITFYPRVFSLQNFSMLLGDTALIRATGVTIARVVIQVVLSLLVQFMAAYALSKSDLWGSKAINLYFLIPMFISGGLIPQYILYSKMHLLNNFWVYVLPGLFSFYNIMIIRSYISLSIPDALVEAAKIDGAGDFRLFFEIVLPLCKPVLATVGLWTAVGSWNDWTTTLNFIQNPRLYTLQYKLMQVIKESESLNALIQATIQNGGNAEALINSITVTPDALISAQIIITTLPVVMIYPFIQKYFVKGIMIGSVKG